jgi:Concanavalin A-like lectin/glucanases superfamily
MEGRIVAVAVVALMLPGCPPSLNDLTTGGGDGGRADAGAIVGEGGDASEAGANSAYATAVLVDHPLVYLRLGEASGIRAADSSGNGNDGAYLGSVVLGVAGAIVGDPNTAARFDGNSGAHILLSGASLNFPGASPFSVEAWVRPEAPISGGANSVVDDDQVGSNWDLFMQSGILKFQRSASQYQEWVWLNAGLPQNQYSHVVGTFDGTAVHLYVEGLDVGDTPATSSLPDPPSQHAEVAGNAGFPGSLDEVAVYDHALTPARILAHYRAGTMP